MLDRLDRLIQYEYYIIFKSLTLKDWPMQCFNFQVLCQAACVPESAKDVEICSMNVNDIDRKGA